ncbi:MAG: hypothetical protein CVV28_04230 [Methanobacteriales archaeon HGW-Methanobacteriales-1]|jgi:hypothetical protein|nr:MAG: hypothetical protein CVV28_04230 [Methanobacteriales archaeon HGW-Methanobacteriales-1]
MEFKVDKKLFSIFVFVLVLGIAGSVASLETSNAAYNGHYWSTSDTFWPSYYDSYVSAYLNGYTRVYSKNHYTMNSKSKYYYSYARSYYGYATYKIDLTKVNSKHIRITRVKRDAGGRYSTTRTYVHYKYSVATYYKYKHKTLRQQQFNWLDS